MEQFLSQQGYRVINCDYPSTRKKISTLAFETIQSAVEQAAQFRPEKIHFVTHSLGGILLRDYLRNHSIKNLAQTVMLSPPNHGSEIVDHFKNNRWFRWILGPAFKDLGTKKNKGINQNKNKADFSVGIITGNKTAIHDRLFMRYFDTENDGKVTVDSAKLKGMKDFIVLPIDHTFIVSDEGVLQQTVHFLKNGCFEHHAS